MPKLSRKDEIIKLFHDDMTIMIGGFLACGTPETLIDVLLESQAKNLTIICNDTAFPEKGIGRLVDNKRIKRLLVSHIGTNPETGRQMNAGEMEVDLIPQGTLAERIRAGGAGLGGVLTRTGIGTDIENGKQKIASNEKEFLIETALKADISLIKGSVIDRVGNVLYKGTTSNFNPVMATAGEIVIAEADELLDGTLAPENVHTSYIYVDYILEKEVNG